MTDTCAETCKHFGFTDPAEPFGWGSNWYCTKHRRRIRDAYKRCMDLEDRFKQSMGKEVECVELQTLQGPTEMG